MFPSRQLSSNIIGEQIHWNIYLTETLEGQQIKYKSGFFQSNDWSLQIFEAEVFLANTKFLKIDLWKFEFLH